MTSFIVRSEAFVFIPTVILIVFTIKIKNGWLGGKKINFQ